MAIVFCHCRELSYRCVVSLDKDRKVTVVCELVSFVRFCLSIRALAFKLQLALLLSRPGLSQSV